jgi:hypothetical protein
MSTIAVKEKVPCILNLNTIWKLQLICPWGKRPVTLQTGRRELYKVGDDRK